VCPRAACEHADRVAAASNVPILCGIPNIDVATKDAQGLINSAMSEQPAPAEIRSRHAVLVVPGEPFLAGGKLAAAAYASMPRAVKDGKAGTTFTKFVVVGHAEHSASPQGISLGDDVCGRAGFSDEDAVRFLKTVVEKYLGSLAPRVLNCKASPGNCPEPSSPSLDQQLPFLSALTNNSLRGHTVPVLLQSQSIQLGVAVGDALALLAASGGVWHAERVLFVFGADMSAGLPAEKAELCDTHAAELLTEQGVPQAAKYFQDLWLGKARKEDCGPGALPRGYASLLAAARVASMLNLKTTRVEVGSSALPEALQGKAGKPAEEGQEGEPPALGYGSLIYWQDGAYIGERLGQASFLASRTRDGRGRGRFRGRGG